MRIRSIKPEFWRSEDIASIDMTVVYVGPVDVRVNEIAPCGYQTEYVYMLFDTDDDLVYIGRSFRPADRFTKHRRKPWWLTVLNAVIVRVAEPSQERPDAARLEAYAIRELRPRANAAVPTVKGMR
ncbi:replication initiation protein [Mycobacterium phage Rebel]|uniref:GIY-YIG domain-containing protein n=1 Tax=Mycobacterium phage Rebel TaxID=2743932 RepID=A0AA48V633_9CAUD|nr:replication initiation protein [Mycobacterium phage Rebel]QKY78934.1 hypothetical protein SEA_REBEL_57 [Mycobacterium phage Rebel]